MADFKTKSFLPEFISVVYGTNFTGNIVLFNKSTFKSHFFDSSSIDALCDAAEKMQKTDDIYIGISTQEDGLPAKKRGSINTVQQVSMLFADIDFSDEKSSKKNYPPNEKVALKILKSFAFKSTFVQNSGHGLHVIFALNNPIVCTNTAADRNHAQALSKTFQKRLIQHFKNHCFEIDSVGDLARIFRVPNSINHKNEESKPVKVLSFNPAQKLDAAEIKAIMQEQQEEPSRKAKNYPPADHELIQANCPWYADVTGKGAATSSEPNWFAAASITACCKDGEAIFHDYSKNHPDYNRRDAEAKFHRVIKNSGPRTCQAICNDLGNEQFCKNCPHFGNITSPVQLGHAHRNYDPGDQGPTPLGYTNNGLYAFLDLKRQIIIQASSSQLLSGQYLMGLAPSFFWRKQFSNSKQGFSSFAAGEALIAACKQEGTFDATRVRGRGVWNERGKIIINLGGVIPAETDFTYLCFDPLPLANSSGFETSRLLEVLKLFPWSKKEDADLFLGWLAVATICGVLDWRPHVFLFGPPNSGKTTLHSIACNLLDPLRITADGQSTEAGIRQILGPDALPVIIDEFETDQNTRRLANVLRLARSASSADSPVLRGTPEGKALLYAIKTMFLFSAVNVTGMSPADDTRIITLELTAHDNNPDTGQKIELERQYFENSGSKWCSYITAHTQQIIDGISEFKKALASFNSRHRQNMATLMSGSFVALHARTPTALEAKTWVEKHLPNVELHSQAHERDDANECLHHLFAHSVSGGMDDQYPLGHWIGKELESLRKGEKNNEIRNSYRIVSTHDMKLVLGDEQPGLLIRNGSPAINRIFENTRWANGSWRRALGQINGAFTLKHPIRFSGSNTKHRCVGLPLDLIPQPLANPSDHEEF